MEVKFVTSNKNKYHEVASIGRVYGIDVKWIEREYLEPQGDSLEEIAKISAEILAKNIDPPFFIEDSGLFIKALNGFPGVYSSYVFKTIGNEGILKLMKDVDERDAYFVCVVAYHDGESVKTFVGEVKGQISNEIRGIHGFGYDPIFEVNGKTFAEIGDRKNEISHRRKAFEKFFRWLAKTF